MTTENIRSMVRRQPFGPFTVRMSDGRSFDITHPDYVSLPPEGWSTTFIIWTKPESFEILSLRQVTGLSSEGDAPAFPARRRDAGSQE